ncbi:hypothetical protein TNIN_381731 [Trichonephila inaurata madagascariensis]|uniref:Uncharacterized protein n=1 Tax=Trichonephila inaurata madagascariensis TaxID=2747483 RepID=A0A8X6Y2K2_9ARAC|nr:hypothetical protein TNIN_205561 [Trichonephila inaurata madagascariensis]GFY73705.1 hypothetical protein TNIN_381731 [Trichonephila inaurata madagascariensis]
MIQKQSSSLHSERVQASQCIRIYVKFGMQQKACYVFKHQMDFSTRELQLNQNYLCGVLKRFEKSVQSIGPELKVMGTGIFIPTLCTSPYLPKDNTVFSSRTTFSTCPIHQI